MRQTHAIHLYYRAARYLARRHLSLKPRLCLFLFLVSNCFVGLVNGQTSVHVINSGELNSRVENGLVQRGPAAPSVTLASQESQVVSVTDAVHSAVEWHPAIGETVEILLQQQQNIRSAKSGYYPQISMNIVGGHDSQSSGNGDGHAVQLYVSQVLYDFGKISGGVDTAKAEARASQARVLGQIDAVARDTAQAAVEVQRYQAQLESADEQINGVEAISKLVRMRSEKGAGSRSDVLQAQSRMEASRANRQQTLAQLNRWKSILQNLMGVDYPINLTMNLSQEISAGCAIDPSQVKLSPDIMIAEAERSAAEAQLKVARASAWPTLSLDGSVNSYLDQEYIDTNALDDNESAVFLNVSMPIYQGGRISASKEAASYSMRSAEAAKDSARLSVQQDLRSTQSESYGLVNNQSILESRLHAISETRDLYRKQYSSLGTRTLVDLLNSEQELHMARTERINNLYDLNQLRIDCLYTSGEIRYAFQLMNSPIQGVEILP